MPPVVYSNPDAPAKVFELLYWICLLFPPGVALPPDVGAATQAITPVVLAERYDDPTPAGTVGGKV